jgi:hypothetical protein
VIQKHTEKEVNQDPILIIKIGRIIGIWYLKESRKMTKSIKKKYRKNRVQLIIAKNVTEVKSGNPMIAAMKLIDMTKKNSGEYDIDFGGLDVDYVRQIDNIMVTLFERN